MRNVTIITGVCGYLGNTVARLALARADEVRGLALPGEDAAMLDPAVRLTRGDVCERESMEGLFAGLGPDDRVTFLHAAGLIAIDKENEARIYEVNVDGTENVLALCKRHAVGKLVYVSSTHALPETDGRETISEVRRFSPAAVTGAYSKSKAMASQMVLDAAAEGLNATVVHPAGMLGPGDYGRGLITQLVADYLNGVLKICIRGGYNFADVRDVAAGVLAAAERGGQGACYILSNRPCTIMEILSELHKMTGKRRIRLALPTWLVRGFVPLAEWYFKVRHEKPLITRDSLKILTSNANFSFARAKRELGYMPRELHASLADTVAFLRERKRVPAGL